MWSAKNLHTRGNSGKRRSTQESLNVTLCRSTNRTTSHSSPQRLTKICRNRHARHAPRPRRPKLREVESPSTCGCFAYSGMSSVFQIDEVANEISARSGQQSTKSDVEFCVPPTGFALELSTNSLSSHRLAHAILLNSNGTLTIQRSFSPVLCTTFADSYDRRYRVSGSDDLLNGQAHNDAEVCTTFITSP